MALIIGALAIVTARGLAAGRQRKMTPAEAEATPPE